MPLFLEHADGSWYVTDRGSRRGARTGGIPLRAREPRRLPPRCWIQLGRTTLEVLTEPPLRRLRRQSAEYFRVRLEGHHQETPLEMIYVEAGSGVTKLAPRSRPYRMGRTPFCEIQLADDRLSAEQVEILVSSEGLQVTNSGEHWLVQVGAVRLAPGALCRWDRQDMMQVGPYVFALSDPIGTAIDEVEGTELAATTELGGEPVK